MRICGEEYMDIIWFASDIAGNIVVARSLESEIPEFVKNDADGTSAIAEMLSFPKAISRDRKKQFDFEAMAERCGFYYFVGDHPHESIYRLISSPSIPANIRSQSDEIKLLLEKNILPFNASDIPRFEVVDGEIKLIS